MTRLGLRHSGSIGLPGILIAQRRPSDYFPLVRRCALRRAGSLTANRVADGPLEYLDGRYNTSRGAPTALEFCEKALVVDVEAKRLGSHMQIRPIDQQGKLTARHCCFAMSF